MPPKMTLEEAQNAPTNHRRGPDHWAAQINEDDVRQIRRMYAEGLATKAVLARIYGVSAMAIHFCVTGVTWAHVGNR